MRRRAIKLKRVYDKADPDDGLRVLVDGLWPRGLTKQQASADIWLRDAAPSSALRRWYGHDVRRWRRFREKYREELAGKPRVLALLDDLCRRSAITLLFGAQDEAHNNAVVLREVLQQPRTGARK